MEYNFNLSKIIEDYLKENHIQKSTVASAMNITRSGFGHKFKKNYWGTTDDIIRLSIVVNYDFVSYLLEPLRQVGVIIQSDDYKNRYKDCDRQKQVLIQQIQRSNIQIDMLLEERERYRRMNEF